MPLGEIISLYAVAKMPTVRKWHRMGKCVQVLLKIVWYYIENLVGSYILRCIKIYINIYIYLSIYLSEIWEKTDLKNHSLQI